MLKSRSRRSSQSPVCCEFYKNLSYMRYNYRHFNHVGLLSWCRDDTLLWEKIDLLSTVGRSLIEQCSNGLSLVMYFRS